METLSTTTQEYLWAQIQPAVTVITTICRTAGKLRTGLTPSPIRMPLWISTGAGAPTFGCMSCGVTHRPHRQYILPPADLSISKSVTLTTVSTQTLFGYTLSVNNLGPGPGGSDVKLTDNIPEGSEIYTVVPGMLSAPWDCVIGTDSQPAKRDLRASLRQAKKLPFLFR